MKSTKSTAKDLTPRYKNCNSRLRSNHSCHDSQMEYKTLTELATVLKKVSGTRYSVRYLIKHYETAEALQAQINWIKGCVSAIG